jgi:hypothetical protein
VSRRVGNPDGSPRLELAEEDPVVDTIVAAIQAEDAKAATEAEGVSEEGPELLSEAARSEAENGSPVLAEQAEEAERPATTYFSKKKAAQQAKDTATWLLVIIEGAAMVGFGEDARLLPNERKMIVEPLARIMSRLDPALNDALQKWTDPILLVFGLSTWGMRLYAIAKDKEEGEGPPSKRPPEDFRPKSPGGNGKFVDVQEAKAAVDDVILRAGPDDRLLSQVGDVRFGAS